MRDSITSESAPSRLMMAVNSFRDKRKPYDFFYAALNKFGREYLLVEDSQLILFY